MFSGILVFLQWAGMELIFPLCFQGYSESPDLEFEYADTDKWTAELSGKGFCCDGSITQPLFPLLVELKELCQFQYHFIIIFKPCIDVKRDRI